jgi:hypothetical protein
MLFWNMGLQLNPDVVPLFDCQLKWHIKGGDELSGGWISESL